ncbi:NUDIX domain-containing protein [Streptosporangium carneum]|uniref:Nudix hydrolase domain-containing protein n=1 Tax=Streptosporangium carneum TaxID=47481 RepID=A0A9W6HZR3_9ACTN|nr:NUDIX domain-containing protein [Streptosporangium carneum]GLK08796.1 hypothetical protein GCM10017600_22010 [Streptosporangium carneum]
MSFAVCDHTRVGVLIVDAPGRYLLIRDADHPHAWTSVVGHDDAHGDLELAARIEVAEQLGMAVMSLERVTDGWRADHCHRAVQAGRTPGHHWTIYRATVTGALQPSAAYACDTRWTNRAELQALADRTVAYARGEVTETGWSAAPGLEPIWGWWTRRIRDVDVGAADLARIQKLAERPLPPPSAAS